MSLLLNACADERQISIRGQVVDANGAPLSGAQVLKRNLLPRFFGRLHDVVATTDSDGGFDVTVGADAYGNRTESKFWVTADGFAKQMVIVPVHDGVEAYVRDVRMNRTTVVSISAGSSRVESVTLPNGAVARVRIPAMTESGLRLEVAAIPAASSPGVLSDVAASPQEALASGAMLYVNIVDEDGEPVDVPEGMYIELPAYNMPAIPESEPMEIFVLNEDGRWAGNGVGANPSSPQNIPVAEFGYWNADQNFRTACVRGRAVVGAGSCSGASVSATGPDGLSSFDSSDSQGNFCVTGAQTWGSVLTLGGASMSVQMPSNAGDCTVPSSCAEIGTISVPADACGETDAAPVGDMSCSNPSNTIDCAGFCCPSTRPVCGMSACCATNEVPCADGCCPSGGTCPPTTPTDCATCCPNDNCCTGDLYCCGNCDVGCE